MPPVLRMNTVEPSGVIATWSPPESQCCASVIRAPIWGYWPPVGDIVKSKVDKVGTQEVLLGLYPYTRVPAQLMMSVPGKGVFTEPRIWPVSLKTPLASMNLSPTRSAEYPTVPG